MDAIPVRIEQDLAQFRVVGIIAAEGGVVIRKFLRFRWYPDGFPLFWNEPFLKQYRMENLQRYFHRAALRSGGNDGHRYSPFGNRKNHRGIISGAAALSQHLNSDLIITRKTRKVPAQPE